MKQATSPSNVFCPHCHPAHEMVMDGKHKNRQRYKCPNCKRKLLDSPAVPLDSFGNHLKGLRHSRGFTLEQASNQIGKQRAWLSRIETGARGISLGDLYKICEVYKIRVSKMLEHYEKIFYDAL